MSEIVIYEQEGRPVEVRLEGDTVWLTQRQMADLLDSTVANINIHISGIYGDGELEEEPTIKESLIVQTEGTRSVSRTVKLYNLDMIISVAYRVNSRRGVRFRQWATQVLREHLTQGYTINRQRLESNARELEAALRLVQQTAQTADLTSDTGRGLVDVIGMTICITIPTESCATTNPSIRGLRHGLSRNNGPSWSFWPHRPAATLSCCENRTETKRTTASALTMTHSKVWCRHCGTDWMFAMKVEQPSSSVKGANKR